MAKCLTPVILTNGVSVPCGRCELCRSANRSNWTTRLKIHAKYYDRMPLFLTLTYNDECLPITMNGHSTLFRNDVSAFLKEYKRKYNLNNCDFTYFGCGEYGGLLGRPHYHLLFFGDDELYNLFWQDVDKASEYVRKVWKKGFVHICLAEWSGIHYVTKYVLKEDLNKLPSDVSLPFTIASKGLGMNFLNTSDAKAIKSKLEYLTKNRDLIYSKCPDFNAVSRDSLIDAISFLEEYVPSFNVVLDDGSIVPLPREIRRRLVGSFEHFKDNPLWLYRTLQQCLNCFDYVRDYSDYDATHSKEHWRDSLENRIAKIRLRMNKQKFDLKRK